MAEIEHRTIQLYGRILLTMDIRAVTGLRIGGSPASLGIGALDNPVIRNPLNQQPYIPGSSLRGKMRSLWEKRLGAPQNFPIQRGSVYIHMPEEKKDPQVYEDDEVCRIFGVTGDMKVPNPTRLIVHDAFLSEESIRQLENVAQTDQPFTETKWEAVIDRVTSAAVPRQMERVPAGVVFGDAQLAYSVFGTMAGGLDDILWFFDVVEMLLLVEDDYLGSSGSRGSGQVKFENLRLTVRSARNYGAVALSEAAGFPQALLDRREDLVQQIYDALTQG
ncbi:type III-A CRISPR-associated RAMP protein Csm3 [Aggregatilinea lenta]|uniref:type III-A CRISPR-associated RAMP protein Csm3 n=1 Tax=Aggregatilinea lenta TaxID=913108 RepID=UPI000E5B5201|nr:type III-A CRISPR-associated RAMP protein Csm3 [Aggregatilinea lenta]